MSRAKEERAALRAQTTELLNNLGSNADAVAPRHVKRSRKSLHGCVVIAKCQESLARCRKDLDLIPAQPFR